MSRIVLLIVFFATVSRTEFLRGERFTVDAYILDGEAAPITIEAPSEGFDALTSQQQTGTHAQFSYQVRQDAAPGLYRFAVSTEGQTSYVWVRVQPVVAPPARALPVYLPVFRA